MHEKLESAQTNFDLDRAISVIQINGDFIKRAVLEPRYLLDTSVDRISTQMPSVVLLNQSIVSREIVPLQRQWFGSNRRLKLGKVYLPISNFTVSKVIGFDDGHAQLNRLKRLPCLKVNDSHMGLVVGAIIDMKRDEFREAELTFLLRNKGAKAKDIQKILGALIHYGALKMVESTHAESPSVGRKPSNKYQVLWGASEFFPQQPESKEDQE